MIKFVEPSPYPSIVLMIVHLVLSSYILLKGCRSLPNTLSLKQTLNSFHQVINQSVIITLLQTRHGKKDPTPA